ncbi:hypothetical protein PRIPAC_73938 [Pristionchus pacificus]|uniref:Uncharacterized protein n=1 Tax=Pristionchus pacificus TaxID=54126 RepID=A0A2A6CT52_PRIPA|nr:hypothetical protein PRIPAC_73938 [Pristionchus pacificus]|eukprot:PDM81221.1 hypothetical protein PRIPAC_36224 [Pristionchus pacificus]
MLKLKVSRLLSLLKSSSKKKSKKAPQEDKQIDLPSKAWSLILEYSSPVDVVKWRRINREIKCVIDDRLSRLLYLDVWRMDTTSILPRHKDNDGDFFRVRSSNLLLHMDSHSLVLVSSSHWTTRDVERLWAAINMFRTAAMTLTMDASVMEMVVAGMALSDSYTQWIKSSESEDRLNNNEEEKQAHDEIEPFFPSVREMTVRVSRGETSSLLSLPSYSVPPYLIVPFQTLQLFRLHLVGSRSGNGWKSPLISPSPNIKLPSGNVRLKPFKQWLNIDRLGERYCQQFS